MHQIVGFGTFSPKCNHPGKNATGFLKSETGLSGNATSLPVGVLVFDFEQNYQNRRPVFLFSP